MANDDLRVRAATLEKRIEAGRPGRHRARQYALGTLVTTGLLALPFEVLEVLQQWVKGDQGARLLSSGMLEQQGYEVIRDDDGAFLCGPKGYPEGPTPQPGSMLPVEDDSAAATGTGGPGSLSGARRQVMVSCAYADWAAFVRRRDVWDQYQEQRAWVLGELLLVGYVRGPRQKVQRLLRDGDPVEAELWSDDELQADYPDGVGLGMTSTPVAVI